VLVFFLNLKLAVVESKVSKIDGKANLGFGLIVFLPRLSAKGKRLFVSTLASMEMRGDI